MDFRIADTFTDSLAKLTGEEQRAVKTTAFDLQMKSANPGMQFHKLDSARDKNFWSVRVNKDIRLIVHRTSGSLLLCYVDHHDKAYQWAERRKLETHPKTGAAQFVEIRERVEEITVPKYVEIEKPAVTKPPLFENMPDDELLGYGVPAEWIGEVRKATEDSILEIADHLPAEAAEALLNIATGGKPKPIPLATVGEDPFLHPDAQRRFRLVNTEEELAQALEYPWEKWTIFLHPAQRQIVEREYSGPARVSGSAGTGKTIVALHRAVHLARSNPDSRVLLSTFSEALANALATQLRRLIGKTPSLGERLEVHSMNAIGIRLYEANFGRLKLASQKHITELLQKASDVAVPHKFSLRFLLSEWEQVVDAWQLKSWEEYCDVKRLGRKTRLPEQQRQTLWTIFQKVRSELTASGVLTIHDVFGALAQHYAESTKPPFEYCVVDEAQDISVSQLRFLAAIGANQPNALFFAGDLGQRIFQHAFSWKELGVEIRGRSQTLFINYRTSHQIRQVADRLLAEELADVDGNMELRQGTVSVFNGSEPKIEIFGTPQEEIEAVASWLSEKAGSGLKPHEIGVFDPAPIL